MFPDPHVSPALPVNVCWGVACAFHHFAKGVEAIPNHLMGTQPVVQLWPIPFDIQCWKNTCPIKTPVEAYYQAGFQCAHPLLIQLVLSPGSSPSSRPLPQCTLDQCAQSRWGAKKTVSPPAMSRLITPPFSFFSFLSLSFHPPTLFFPHSQDLEHQTLICLYF